MAALHACATARPSICQIARSHGARNRKWTSLREIFWEFLPWSTIILAPTRTCLLAFGCLSSTEYYSKGLWRMDACFQARVYPKIISFNCTTRGIATKSPRLNSQGVGGALPSQL